MFRQEDDGDEVALATATVRSYERTSQTGRPERVRQYQRMWWVPHPDWERGQQRWITAGEAAWNQRGEQARAASEAGEAAQDKAQAAAGAGDTARAAGSAEAAQDKAQAAPSGAPSQLGQQGRPAHGYLLPDPERLVTARGKYKRPEDHPFFQRNPVSADNLKAGFADVTPSEKNQGLRWYSDGHRLAWVLGGGDAHLGAMMLSAYSPRTGWPLNMFNAARSLAEGRALGPGDGVIMGSAQKTGEAILGGADVDTALPSPKTNAFARLLTLGEDHPDDPHGQVVIDRHALSAAAGRRLTKADTEGKGEFKSPIGEPRFYEHVADQFRIAARDISDQEGEEISPAQLQAMLWLRQQRLNTAADLADARGNKGLVTALRNHWTAWTQYAKEHGIPTEIGITAPAVASVTAGEVPAGTRSVPAAEFHDLATRGRDLLNGMEGNRSAVTGLVSNWDSLKQDAWQAASKADGHLTLDPRSGSPLPADADRYALTATPPGFGPVSVPEAATQDQFSAAMDEALVRFRPVLEQSGFYLAVFHDGSSHRIDIEPVAVVQSRDDAEALAAYTHNTGGAYHFRSGSVVHPPFVKGELGLPEMIELAVADAAEEGLPLVCGEVQVSRGRHSTVSNGYSPVPCVSRFHAVAVGEAEGTLDPVRHCRISCHSRLQ